MSPNSPSANSDLRISGLVEKKTIAVSRRGGQTKKRGRGRRRRRREGRREPLLAICHSKRLTVALLRGPFLEKESYSVTAARGYLTASDTKQQGNSAKEKNKTQNKNRERENE